MASSCNMKVSGKYKKWKEGEYALHGWTKSGEIVVILDHFRKFKGI